MLGTCLAVDLIRAIVLTVVKEVAAQSGADASVIGTEKLVLLTCGNDRRGLCGRMIYAWNQYTLSQLRKAIISLKSE